MYTTTTINVQGDWQDAFEVYADDKKEQTIGFVFDEDLAEILPAAQELVRASKLLLDFCYPDGDWRGDVNMKGVLGAVQPLRLVVQRIANSNNDE